MAIKLEARGIKYALQYETAGDQAEVIAAYTTDGIIITPNDKPYWECGDYHSAKYGEVQVKSPRATVCEGWDIRAHINRDAAEVYAYVTKEQEWVVLLTPQEWEKFLTEFSFETYHTSNGAPKRRLKKETKLMLMYLDRLINGTDYSLPYYLRG